MNNLPDWAFFTLLAVALLLTSGGGVWLFGKHLVGGILKFIAKYSK